MLEFIHWKSALALVIAVFVGCSKGPAMGDIYGTVTLDGKPLETGTINFFPVNGDTQTTGGVIKNGKFEVRVPVSKQIVKIASTIVTSPPGTPDELLTFKKLVPDKYNLKSELRLDVKAGRNEPVYDLKSK